MKPTFESAWALETMTASQALSLVSAAAAGSWLGIIVLLHFIKRELNPRTQMVSEYALPPRGWLMRIAFVCLATSCWALAGRLWSLFLPVGSVLIAICGVGAAGAGAFVTDPILLTDRAQTRSGGLHILFSLLVILLFPLTATVIGFGLNLRIEPDPRYDWLRVLSFLPWAGLLSFAGATSYHSRHPATPLGYFERILIIAYTAWLIATGIGLAT
jgi:hypothetical protein